MWGHVQEEDSSTPTEEPPCPPGNGSSLPLPLLPHGEGVAPFRGQMADLRWGTWRQVQTPDKQGLSHPLEFPYPTLQRTLVSSPIL